MVRPEECGQFVWSNIIFILNFFEPCLNKDVPWQANESSRRIPFPYLPFLLHLLQNQNCQMSSFAVKPPVCVAQRFFKTVERKVEHSLEKPIFQLNRFLPGWDSPILFGLLFTTVIFSVFAYLHSWAVSFLFTVATQTWATANAIALLIQRLSTIQWSRAPVPLASPQMIPAVRILIVVLLHAIHMITGRATTLTQLQDSPWMDKTWRVGLLSTLTIVAMIMPCPVLKTRSPSARRKPICTLPKVTIAHLWVFPREIVLLQ